MIDADRGFAILGIVLMGALVLSALLSRRPRAGLVARSIAGWIAVFGVAILAFSYRGEIMAVADRVGRELNLVPQQRTQGSSLVVPIGADGHFSVIARVNGVEARFLIDSGATVSAIGPKLAEQAGVSFGGTMVPAYVQTANGPVEVARGRVRLLEVGPIASADLGIVSAEAFGDMNVLGMNFLSSLRSWRVEGREMILEPHDGPL